MKYLQMQQRLTISSPQMVSTLFPKIIVHNVNICDRAGSLKLRPVPNTKRNKDNKTFNYTSTPPGANILLAAVLYYFISNSCTIVSKMFLESLVVKNELKNMSSRIIGFCPDFKSFLKITSDSILS